MYIDEITQYKQFLSSDIYEKFEKKSNTAINKLNTDFENACKGLSELDIERLSQELDYEVSLVQLAPFRFLSSLYLGLFSVWELQVKNYPPKTIRTHETARMKEFANLVNVLKHGKEPRRDKKESSYDKLKKSSSAYLQPSHFDKIIREVHGGVILNISLIDLLSLCDEIINIWSNKK